MRFFRWAVSIALLAFLVPGSHAQAPGPHAQTAPPGTPPPPPPPDFATKYDRSEQGLRTQLQYILTNAKDPEKTKLLVHALALPKYDDYFSAVYQSDVEPFWSGSYTRALMEAPAKFELLFPHLGTQDGEFKIRRIDEAPASKLESALASKMKGPVDIYAVSWNKRKAADSSDEQLLGYYAYLGGRFHWLYVLGFPKTAAEAAKSAAPPSAQSSTGAPKAPASGGAGSAAGKPGASSRPVPQPPSQQ